MTDHLLTAPDTANLTREEARHRSAHLTVLDYRVGLDVRTAPDPQRPTFATTTTVRFAADTDVLRAQHAARSPCSLTHRVGVSVSVGSHDRRGEA